MSPGYASMYGTNPGAGPQGNYFGTEQRDGATIDKYMVQEARQVPFKQITYTTQEVQQPRTYMEPVTKSIQVPKMVMEPYEMETKHYKIEMDTRTIQVPKQIMEDQEIQVQVPHRVSVPIQKMVPRTVLVPVTVYVEQVQMETETRTIKVPKMIMEDKDIEVPKQIFETVTKTVQRPKTVMESKTITIQEPKSIQVPRQVQSTTMQTRTHWQQTPKIVEYERPQMVPGRYVKTYDAPAHAQQMYSSMQMYSPMQQGYQQGYTSVVQRKGYTSAAPLSAGPQDDQDGAQV